MGEAQKQAADLNLQEEEALLKEPSADELRQKVMEEYGFNEEEHSELIDKLTEERKEFSKKLSTAIKQKRSWREKAQANIPLEPEAKPQEKEPSKGAEAPKGTSNYSLKDIRALSSVHDEDVERVEKFAQSENISISEALLNDDLKAILRDREERRATAAASNTGKTRVGISKTSIKELRKAKDEKGELPDSEEDIQRIAEAEIEEKLKGK